MFLLLTDGGIRDSGVPEVMGRRAKVCGSGKLIESIIDMCGFEEGEREKGGVQVSNSHMPTNGSYSPHVFGWYGR